jgi:4-amino-4-deoxy-L-arabinose transferase-like glycosyltransferase
MSVDSTTGAERPVPGTSGIPALLAIVAVAAALRVWGIAPDLPYVFHPDEPVYIAIIQNIFKTGDLNPHWFSYPSFLFYLNALAYVPYYWIGKLLGAFHTTADILPVIRQAVGTAYTGTPSAVLLSRLVTATVGTGAVVIAFLVGRRLTGRVAVGLLAAAMLAVSPTNVIHSRIIWPGAFVVFWSLVALLGAVRVYQEGRTRDYVFAGIGIGMTAASACADFATGG